MFTALRQQPADSLLALIGMFRNDTRADKIDLGVGVYRDENNATPVLRAVKAAEARLLETQNSKSYLGPEGDARFVDLLRPIIFGAADAAFADRLTGVQTPGGTGALRLAGELIARAAPGRRVWLGLPSWPNHAPIFTTCGLTVATYQHMDAATGTVDADALLAALGQAEAGDVVVLHGCCHNPTGADLNAEQWRAVAALIAERGLLPLIDLAYQGLGDGLEEDAAGMRTVLAQVPEALIAYSCDKNFGVYRDRVGALYALSGNGEGSAVVRSNLLALARANYSMPPDHGAAAVRLVLESPELTADWQAELTEMRTRVNAVRQALAAHGRIGGVDLARLATQKGLFSLLTLGKPAIITLRQDHGVYMAESGRINVAGLALKSVPALVKALTAVAG